MKQRLLRLGRFLGLTAVVASVVATASLVDASATIVPPNPCPTNKLPIVNSSATFENTADFAVDGHVWALDSGTHFIQIWSLRGNAYCVEIRQVGTTTTFAGGSPEGTGIVPGGLTAVYGSTIYGRLNGTLSQTAPRTGPIGDFDFECDQNGICNGSPLDILLLYFPSVHHLATRTYAFTYDAGSCGTLIQTNAGDSGDIAC